MKKVIGLVVIALVAGAMFVGCVEEESPAPTPTPTPTSEIEETPRATPTPTPTPEPTPTPIKVDSFDLALEFDDNSIAAEAKYEGQIIEVKGDILDIDRDLSDTPYVKLYGLDEYGISCVMCRFSPSAESQLLQLRKYDVVTIRGSYSEYRMSRVVLENCELVRVE